MLQSNLNQTNNLKKSNNAKIWFMWLCGCIFYLYQYLLKTSVCIMRPDIVKELMLTDEFFALVSSFFYLSYAIMQIFAGSSLDKYGPCKPLSFASFLCALGALIFSISTNSSFLLFSRVLIGIGSAYGLISCVKIVSTWFSKDMIPILLPATMLFGTFGGILSGLPLEKLIQYCGWRNSMMIFGIFLSITVYLTFLKTPKHLINTKNKQNIIASLRYIFSNKNVFLILLFGFFSYIPLSGFGEMWSYKYISFVLGENALDSGKFVSCFFLGIGIGSMGSIVIYKILKSYRQSLMLCAFATMICYMVVLFDLHLNYRELLILYFFMGFFNSIQVLAFAYIITLFNDENSGLASGVLNFFIMITGFIAQPLMGYINSKNMLEYNNIGTAPYQNMFLLIVWCLLLEGTSAAMLNKSK